MKSLIIMILLSSCATRVIHEEYYITKMRRLIEKDNSDFVIFDQKEDCIVDSFYTFERHANHLEVIPWDQKTEKLAEDLTKIEKRYKINHSHLATLKRYKLRDQCSISLRIDKI